MVAGHERCKFGTQGVQPLEDFRRQWQHGPHAGIEPGEQHLDLAARLSHGHDRLQTREDPTAQLKTQGYYTYPIYAEDAGRVPRIKPQAIGWRVGQSLQAKSSNLLDVPKTVAAAQKILSLNGVAYGLSGAAQKKLDAALIAATFQNLNDRTTAIATAMSRNPKDAVLEVLDFEGSGQYAQNDAMPKMAMMRAMSAPQENAVEEPSFEPGETGLSMRAVAKLRFK